LGRPKRVFDREKVIELSNAGKSARSIASMLGVGKDTIYAVLRA
jgi:transposase